ncbi:phosphomevalonate kinase-like protein [Rhexocercosporidium sp. MPI-PUGE-AT-0058]|nr:phosphomevalonate kinase-like protein [Rhexocercosporidium sp. MPI-PUGE-AT-0058]
MSSIVASPATAVSAPGKVLLAGGYLVLDRAYTGLVFGLSARIHVIVHDIETSSGVELSEIVVQSPQFRDATWNYGYHLVKDRGGVEVTQLQGSSIPLSRNPFVETALAYALTYISTLVSTTIKPSKVTILADNDYYSNTSTTTLSSPTATHKFTDFGVRLQDAHKTGLGSSAALVTAFTGAILSHYLPSSLFSLTTPEGRSRLHNLAQAAHCAAQGKVGSGFDVAAAVYGTCVYRRFSPSILSSLGEPSSSDFATRVKNIVEDTADQKWDTEISKGGVTIPKGMALVMCDVDCGSQTVGMVKKVLEWRKNEAEEAKKLWDDLQGCNDLLAEELTKSCAIELSEAFVAIRALIKDMSRASGVPIEPEEQTELLNAVTRGVNGVTGGVVPGAGGYDAIVLLVQDDEETKAELEAFLKKWSEEKKGNVKLLAAKGELEGARVEDAAAYGKF